MGAVLVVPQVVSAVSIPPKCEQRTTWDGGKAFKSDCAGSQVCRWCDDRTTCAGKKPSSWVCGAKPEDELKLRLTRKR